MSDTNKQAKIAWVARTLGVHLGTKPVLLDAASFTKRMNALMPAVAAAANGPGGSDIRAKAEQAVALARGREFTDAARLLAEIETMLDTATTSGLKGSQGIAQWQSARSGAVASLTALETAIRKVTHPNRDKAIIIVRAIRANLTERPETIEQVKNLESYLITDQVIEVAEKPNKLGVQIALRKPLLAALLTLRADLTARI
jgi:hypothetical protein